MRCTGNGPFHRDAKAGWTRPRNWHILSLPNNQLKLEVFLIYVSLFLAVTDPDPIITSTEVSENILEQASTQGADREHPKTEFNPRVQSSLLSLKTRVKDDMGSDRWNLYSRASTGH